MRNIKLMFWVRPLKSWNRVQEKKGKLLNDAKSNGVSKNEQHQTHVLDETPEVLEPSPRKK